ncbi:MAG: hypothetical protein H6Q11_1516 [Acidobacteria bacterium]|nr:hypothetical protein [Acidobacteriota bacterium]
MREAEGETAARSAPGEPERSGVRGLAAQLWSPPYRRALAWAAPVLLLAYGFAMTNFALAGDDWFAIVPEGSQDSVYALVAGRWLMPVVWAITGNNAFVPYFTFAVALVLLAAAGLVACATWGFKRPWAVFSVVTLFAANPLFTDTLAVKPAHVTSPLAMVCAAGAGWVLLRWAGGPARRIAVAAGLLVPALAAYQPTALAFVVVVIGAEVIAFTMADGGYRRGAVRRWAEILAAVAAGLLVYILSVRVSWWLTGTDPQAAQPGYSLGGGYPSSPGELGDALRYGLGKVGRFWFGSTSLYPIVLKACSLAVALAGMAAAAAAAVAGAGRGSWRSKTGRVAWVALLGLVSVVAPFAVLLLREEPPLRGAVFATVGLALGFWAGMLVERLAASRVSGPPRAVAGAAAALYLGNQRDLANANRMLSVMEQMPEFSRGTAIRVALVGQVRFFVPAGPFTDEVPDVPGVSIVNCSGLACQNRLVRMFNLIGAGDREFLRRSAPDNAAAAALIESMPGWPEPGSIRFLGGVFVVKGS